MIDVQSHIVLKPSGLDLGAIHYKQTSKITSAEASGREHTRDGSSTLNHHRTKTIPIPSATSPDDACPRKPQKFEARVSTKQVSTLPDTGVQVVIQRLVHSGEAEGQPHPPFEPSTEAAIDEVDTKRDNEIVKRSANADSHFETRADPSVQTLTTTQIYNKRPRESHDYYKANEPKRNRLGIPWVKVSNTWHRIHNHPFQ